MIHNIRKVIIAALFISSTSFITASSVLAQALPTITNGQTVTVSSMSKGGEKVYQITLPTGAKNLVVMTTGTSGDADIYLRKNQQPTTRSYSWKSTGNTSSDKISVRNPSAGVYYVLLYAYSATQNTSLTLTYTAPVVATPLPVPGVCTADAYLCPDGGYVGRTGVNCTFTCPVTTPPTPPIVVAPVNYTLSASVSGGGTISTMSEPIFSCETLCLKQYVQGTSVALIATPSVGYAFSGWTGACSGVGACALTMTENKSTSASFSLIPVQTPVPIPVPTPTPTPTVLQVLPATPASISQKQGSSFEITYNWNVARLDKNYAVFVHFINSAGAIVFQDDFTPSTPTSQWSGAVSQKHTVTIPQGVPAGVYSVKVGMWDQATGLRVILNPGTAVLADPDVRYQVATLNVTSSVPVVVTPTPTPIPTPTPTPTPVPNNTSTSINITDLGAVGNGTTNNSTAINNAIAQAKATGKSVFIPAGTFAYNGVIRLDGVKMHGVGDMSVLYALNYNQEAIFMYGSGSEVRTLKLSGVKSTVRGAEWEKTRFTLFGASNFVIDGVTVDGSAAAGIQTSGGVNNGRITNNVIKNTLADSIHMTDRASYITLENNRIDNAGDDGIAVVSYVGDGGLVNHITARNNVITNNKWGRLMSVVGGSDILYENNMLDTNQAPYACLYLAQENSYNTYGVSNVVARYNTLKNCGSLSTGHGAVMLYSNGNYQNSNISLIRNDIVQNGTAGIMVFGSNTGITVDSNKITGASPSTKIDTPGVTFVGYSSGSVGYVAP